MPHATMLDARTLAKARTKTAAGDGQPLWKVRVCLPGSMLHLVSQTEPVIHMHCGRIADISASWVTDTADAGDTIGFIDWPAVVAVTWRASAPPNGD
jgi:hypothetical protein